MASLTPHIQSFLVKPFFELPVSPCEVSRIWKIQPHNHFLYLWNLLFLMVNQICQLPHILPFWCPFKMLSKYHLNLSGIFSSLDRALSSQNRVSIAPKKVDIQCFSQLSLGNQSMYTIVIWVKKFLTWWFKISYLDF